MTGCLKAEEYFGRENEGFGSHYTTGYMKLNLCEFMLPIHPREYGDDAAAEYGDVFRVYSVTT